MSVYDTDDKCKICGAHTSEYHREGCELGETKKELNIAARIIEQFRNLLDVETTTSGFEKVAELMGKGRRTPHAPDTAHAVVEGGCSCSCPSCQYCYGAQPAAPVM
jgi:hypothetical protein